MPTQGALFSPRGAEPEEYGRATSQDLDPGSYAHEGSDGENCFTGDQPDDDSFGYQESDWVMPTQAPEDEDFVYGDPPGAGTVAPGRATSGGGTGHCCSRGGHHG